MQSEILPVEMTALLLYCKQLHFSIVELTLYCDCCSSLIEILLYCDSCSSPLVHWRASFHKDTRRKEHMQAWSNGMFLTPCNPSFLGFSFFSQLSSIMAHISDALPPTICQCCLWHWQATHLGLKLVAHPFLDSEQWCLRESAKVPVTKIDFRLPSFLHSICLNISVLENQWTHSSLVQWYKKCWRKRSACDFRLGFYPYRHTATLYSLHYTFWRSIRMEILAQSVKGEFYQMYVITYKFFIP